MARPLLINPYVKDPEPHFEWDMFGNISSKTEDGQTTIDVCGLDRKYLINERQRTASEVAKLVKDLVVAKKTDNKLAFKQTAERLVRCGHESNAYAGMVRSLIHQSTSIPYASWAKKYPS